MADLARQSSPSQLAHGTIYDVEALEEEYLALVGQFDAPYTEKRNAAVGKILDAWPKRQAAKSPDEIAEADAALTAAAAEWRHLFYQFVHGNPRSAVCLSGGGIRSATFSLGALEGLAERSILSDFTYLSTVSGGGYIGSWLSAWFHREPASAVVCDQLHKGRAVQGTLQPEVDAIQRLREYSHYLAPKFGAFTADTWTLVVIYLRNLVVNWMVLLPVLAAVLAVPRVWVALIEQSIPWGTWPLALGGAVALWAAFIVSMTFSFPASDGFELRWWNRDGEGGFLLSGILPFALSGLIMVPAMARWSSSGTPAQLPVLWWAGGGALILFVPWLMRHIWMNRPPFVVAWTGLQRFAIVAAGSGLLALTIAAFYRMLATNIWGGSSPSPIWIGVLATILGGGAVFSLLAENGQRPITTNWMFAIAGLATIASGALGGGLLWLSHGWFVAGHSTVTMVIAGPLIPWSICFVCGVLHLMLSSWPLNDHQLEWYARAGAWMLIVAVAWVAIATVSLIGPAALLTVAELPLTSRLLGFGILAVFGVVTVLAGRSGRTRARAGGEATGRLDRVIERVLTISAPIVMVVILAAVALGTDTVTRLIDFVWMHKRPWTDLFVLLPPGLGGLFRLNTATHAQAVHGIRIGIIAVTPLVLFAFTLLVDALTDINAFSLHGMYRDRLIRAYLAASRASRTANAFTGFDAADDVKMWRLRPFLFRRGDEAVLAAATRKLGAISERELQKARAGDQSARGWAVSKFYGAIGLFPGVVDTVEHRIEQHLGEAVAVAAKAKRSPADDDVLLACWNRILQMDWWNRDDWGLLFDKALMSQYRPLPELSSMVLEAALRSDPILKNRAYLTWSVANLEAEDRIELPLPVLNAAPPFPVVNTALNLVGGKNLAWQQRKAESFSITPLHIGSSALFYRRTSWWQDARIRYFGGDDGISLGTALTVSGAAANPNMGYHSSPVMTFLLALFNARLGIWVGNPRHQKTSGQREPLLALPWLLKEAFGLTNDQSNWVNLSDGGHFENLGLYEMVRRRCKSIIVIDAGQDQDYAFADLGNAVAKVRVDFGVPIEFRSSPIGRIAPEGPRRWSKYRFAVGKIKYSAVDTPAPPVEPGAEPANVDGWLLYIKPVIVGDEPVDVHAYVRSDARFPHQPTANQFFSETQFESYRVLGRQSILEPQLDAVLQGPGRLSDRLAAYWLTN